MKKKIGYIELKPSAKARAYQAWMNRNVTANPKKVMGQCRAKAVAMASYFKELTVVGTSYHGMVSGSEHAWCITKTGKVVDPTAHQFHGRYNYSKDPMHVEDFPTGKCMWCGELYYPDTERNRRHFDPSELGEHTQCNEAMRREYA